MRPDTQSSQGFPSSHKLRRFLTPLPESLFFPLFPSFFRIAGMSPLHHPGPHETISYFFPALLKTFFGETLYPPPPLEAFELTPVFDRFNLISGGTKGRLLLRFLSFVRVEDPFLFFVPPSDSPPQITPPSCVPAKTLSYHLGFLRDISSPLPGIQFLDAFN